MKFLNLYKRKTNRIFNNSVKFIKILLIGLFIISTSDSHTQSTSDNKGQKQNKNQSITTFFLVRHAEKIISENNNPELNADGIERASKLCDMLLKSGVNKIYSTDYIRTIETVKPLADKLDIKIQLYKPGDKKFITNVLSANTGSNILIVGHSNTIPGLVNQLTGEKKYKNLQDNEYNKLFMLSIHDNKSKCTLLQF